ncbi:MAG: BamA/TamA family outer membrane protein [Myxococcota bacterium]
MRRLEWCLVAAAVGGHLLTTAPAYAEETKEVRTATATSSARVAASRTSSIAVRTEKRALPNLDGRAPEGPDAGDVLIWVPRALLSPLHLVFEWGIRKPLGAILTVAERDQWANVLLDFLTADERKIGIVPTFFVDFNFRPSVGVYVFLNEVFVKEHSIRIAAGFGGADWRRVAISDRWQLGPSARLEFGVEFNERPDWIYTGEGISTDPDVRSRYNDEAVGGDVALRVDFWRGSEFRLEAGVNRHRFDDGDASDEDDIALTEAVAQGAFAEPAAFTGGYFASFQQVLLRLDTRQPRPVSQTGFTATGYARHGWDIDDPDAFHWFGYGGSLTGHLDLGHFRTLSLGGQVNLVDPVGDAEVPFTELFVLGRRPQDLSGFLPGILRGRSAAVATLEYTYPVWIFMDAAFQASVGNGFAPNFEDFSLDALRASLGLGLKATQDDDNQFTLLFAFGTSRFDQPFSIDTFRFVFGTQTGF